jgi:hypothetical protein
MPVRATGRSCSLCAFDQRYLFAALAAADFSLALQGWVSEQEICVA